MWAPGQQTRTKSVRHVYFYIPANLAGYSPQPHSIQTAKIQLPHCEFIRQEYDSQFTMHFHFGFYCSSLGFDLTVPHIPVLSSQTGKQISNYLSTPSLLSPFQILSTRIIQYMLPPHNMQGRHVITSENRNLPSSLHRRPYPPTNKHLHQDASLFITLVSAFFWHI